VPDAARPPLGCSFHPRCPSAFEVCGWESRDLRDLLETRWAHQEEAQYVAERAVIDDLTVVDAPSATARLKAGQGHSGGDVVALLERAHEDDPSEPFWTGVRRMGADGGHVEVQWHDPIAPRPLPRGEVTVECHLYDDEALAEADRRRADVTTRSE